MKTVYLTKAESKWGTLHIASSDIGVCKIGLWNELQTETVSWLEKHFDNIVPDYEKNKAVVDQLVDYINGNLKEFTMDIHLIGTSFQKSVWNELIKVPYGEVCSYKELAIKAGSPKGFRAVGMANNRNPIPIIIPCHRVIGSDGALVGYGGGLDMKIKLLELEGSFIHKGKVVTEK